MQKKKKKKKKNYPFDPVRALHVAHSPSGEAQPYLSHVTPRCQVHADWTKTVGARGIQTNKQTDRAILIL